MTVSFESEILVTMPCSEFVHLRLHTAYSLLEGAIKIADLVKQCQKMGMPAVAMTDTCNLFGALDFSTNCAQGGIQPIIGCQLAVSTYMPESITDVQRSPPSNLRKGEISLPDQIILLAQNKIGYDNLLQLVSKYHLEENQLGNSYISYDLLNLYGEGLIAFTGGPAGGVGKLLFQGKNKHAETLLLKLRDIFKDRLYVELMRHNLETERFIEKDLIDLAYEHGLPLIATNECYFISEDMYEAHDALICISESTYVDQSERRRLTPEHRLKSAEEMSSLFSDLPEAIENTILVAKRCATMAEPCRPLLPPAPKSKDDKRSDDDVLENLAKIGLEKRLQSVVLMGLDDFSKTEAITKPYHERLRFELDVIGEMGFSGYFLIVADFIRWAKAEGIPVGPGRGSGAGSVVAWALTITDLDPLKFGLLFERFLNPERISMPDFDIDFCQERRDEVIRYVQGKYGEDRVAQIITFGTLQPRAALRDVGRVLGMPYGQVDGICKLVPNNPANPTTLEKAIDDEPLLRKEVELNAGVARLLEISMKLEGLYRHASTHAAGVVIGDRPLTDLIPLYRDPRSDIPVTQFSMKWAEAAGLVKFDFLGLKTLTIFSTTQELLKQRNLEIDLNNLPLDDSATFEMLGRGETTGVFQLESSGMRDILRNMKPDSFEDIIAIVALYRPGPMDNIPSYIRRKHGTEESDFLYPSLEPILSETYGIMIYQEQVMQIAQELAGYSLGGADLLRRAMGKKIKEEMSAQREDFIAGSVCKGVPEKKASDIFEQVAKFAGYGFNKSHAAAYAFISYQTAYLKANFPTEFIAASMTLDIHNTDKLNAFKQELDRINISLLEPDINKSKAVFSVELEKKEGQQIAAVRYALAAIKNVGQSAMESLVINRDNYGPFDDLQDLVTRLDSKIISKRQFENLVKAGALDQLTSNRRQLFEGTETIIRQGNVTQQERESDQIRLFGSEDLLSDEIHLPDVPDWEPMERLKEEFDAIGFYLSAHPLDNYTNVLKRLKIKKIVEIEKAKRQGLVALAGVIISKKDRLSQKGKRFSFLQLSDQSGIYEIIVFSELLAAKDHVLISGHTIFVKATAQFEGETIRITAHDVQSLEEMDTLEGAGLKIFVDEKETLPSLKEVLSSGGAGQGEVILVSRVNKLLEVEVRLPETYNVSSHLTQSVKSIPGIIDVIEI